MGNLGEKLTSYFTFTFWDPVVNEIVFVDLNLHVVNFCQIFSEVSSSTLRVVGRVKKVRMREERKINQRDPKFVRNLFSNHSPKRHRWCE